MDITFHYPPELFELLVDAIPLLFRSKEAVLLFFQGAGVESNLTNDLWNKVKLNKDSIKKYEIVRTTLTRLNEKGDKTLRERRELLKRVIEFEDFSTCWPNDQLKAKGLVYEIRRVVNVKDSFTKMRQERDKERQKHQLEYKTRIDEVEQKKAEFNSIKKEFFSLFTMPD